MSQLRVTAQPWSPSSQKIEHELLFVWNPKSEIIVAGKTLYRFTCAINNFIGPKTNFDVTFLQLSF